MRCPRCKARGFESGTEPCSSCGWTDPVLETWVPAAWYADPAQGDRARYWNGRRWEGKPSAGVRFGPVPTEPPERPEPPIKRVFLAVVPRCSVLGGHGLGVPAGAPLDLGFQETSVLLLRDQEVAATVPYAAVLALEIGGPGTSQSGGGFAGGGFGIEGAAGGMLVASALNMLTARTQVDTVICLQTDDAELFLHNGESTPDTLRMQLSVVFNKLRQAGRAREQRASSSPVSSAIDEIAKLGDLLERGLIDENEFSALKAKLIE